MGIGIHCVECQDVDPDPISSGDCSLAPRRDRVASASGKFPIELIRDPGPNVRAQYLYPQPRIHVVELEKALHHVAHGRCRPEPAPDHVDHYLQTSLQLGRHSGVDGPCL